MTANNIENCDQHLAKQVEKNLDNNIFPLVPKKHFLLVSISVTCDTMRGNTVAKKLSSQFRVLKIKIKSPVGL